MALALRLAAYELLRSDGGDPVLLLDDVFAELDSARRRALAERRGVGRTGAGRPPRCTTTSRGLGCAVGSRSGMRDDDDGPDLEWCSR